MIGKSGSPPRCAGRSRSDSAENDVQIAVARKLQVPVVIATPLAAKFAVMVARSYSAAFSSIPKSSARLRGDAPASALPDRRDLGRSRSIKKMDRGKKTGDLRDDFINLLGCRGMKVFYEVACLKGAACEFGGLLILDPCVSLKSRPAVPAGWSRGYIILCNITYITSCQFLVSISMRI